MAEVVQADYEALAGVAKRFATHASAIQQLHSRLGRQAAQLRSAWIGKGSEAFFTEMTDKVLPAIQRLSAALTEAERVTKQVEQVLREAEEQGAAPFEQMEGGGDPGGESGDAAGSDGSGDALGDDFMRSLDEFTREISIDNPGSGAGGAWSEEGYLPGDMGGSGFDQIENDYGFGDAADLGGAGSATGGGAGGANEFAVPEDWLDGVTGDGSSPWGAGGAGGMGEMGGGSGAGSGGEMGGGSGSGGETGGGAGSGGMPTGSGSPMDSGGMPAGAGSGAGQGGGAGAGSEAAARLPEPLRYQPLGSGVISAPAAGSAAAAGMQAGHGGMVSGAAPAAAQSSLGIPTGLAALGPLVALLGKAIKDRTSK